MSEVKVYERLPPRIFAVEVERGSVGELNEMFSQEWAPFRVLGGEVPERSGVWQMSIQTSENPTLMVVPEGALLCWNAEGHVWIDDPDSFPKRYKEVT